MASASLGSSHLGMTDNQKRWLVAGIALNKILIPQIRPFVEQGIQTEYNKLKTSHNIDTQSASHHINKWPATSRDFLKYENINGNDTLPKLYNPDGKSLYNYSAFNYQVTSHVDFARLYVENHMAHFTAFDDHCNASVVLILLGRVPVFSGAIQTAADRVRKARNEWAHCVFGKWDQVKFLQSFTEMEHLVRNTALPTADKGKLLGELKDWKTKGTHLCMNSPLDPALLKLVQQELKSLQDDVKNMSVEKTKIETELKNCASVLEYLQQRMERIEIGHQDTKIRVGLTEKKMEILGFDQMNLEQQAELTEKKMERLEIDQKNMGQQAEVTEKRVDNLESRVSAVEKDEMSKREGVQRLLVKPRLPPEDKDFMGRKMEYDEIIDHLSCESTRIISIFGPPGFGKSQVAIAVGNELKFQGKTVYHLELRGVQTKDELVSQFRCNFNVPPNCRDLTGEELLFNLFSQVNGQLYFILDNADKLLNPNVKDDTINLIKQILTKFLNVTFIVTTRESPVFMQLESLGQKLVNVGPLGTLYCQNLVQKLLPDCNDDNRKKIVQLCGNMPFAIILMSRSIKQNEKDLNEAIDEFIRSTKRIVKELDNPEEVSDKRLFGIFGSSFESLSSQNDREAFVSLSVIPGSFDEDVASAVLGKFKAKETLERLHRRSLIDSRSGLYQMHKLLQSFGMEKGREKEMEEVMANAKQRFHDYYIWKFSELNKQFLSGKSMTAFVAFYQEKDIFVSSLIEGCSEGGKTSNGAFDVLVNAELFLDILLWSDGATFDRIYDSALKEAEKLGSKTIYNQLVVAKSFSEVTWGTAEEINTMQTLSFTEESRACSSSVKKLIEGKRSCYLGIYQLVNGKLEEGVKSLENAFSNFDGTTKQLSILKVLTCQILSLYYESENRLEKANEFYKYASDECNRIEDPSLIAIPQVNKSLSKEEKLFRNPPLAMEVYFLISKAIKIFSEKTVKSLEQDVLQIEKGIYQEDPIDSCKSLGIFQFHRIVVSVLGEMGKFEEAIASIQATICLQKTALMKCTNDGQKRSSDIENKDAITEDSMPVHEHKEALAKSYFYLAVLQFRVKDYKGSFQSQRLALEIRRELFGEGNANTADSYQELGIISRTLEDCNSALYFQQRALDIRLNLSDRNPSKTADSYHELGVTHCTMGDYSAGLRCHESALKIRREHLGNPHKDTASSYHEKGIAQWYLGEYECALGSYNEALKIKLEVFGEHHSETADSYHELGKTHFCLENYRESLKSHSKALRIRKDVLGEEHCDTANSIYEIAVTEFKIDCYPSALRNHKRSLATRQKIHEVRQSIAMESEIAQSYHQLGRIQSLMGDYSQAFDSLNRALAVRRLLLGEEHPEIAESYYELGKTFFSKKDYVSSFVMHQLALYIRKKTLGEEDAKTADSLCQMGLVQFELGNKQSSLDLHKRAQEIRQKRFGTKHNKTAESHYQVGRVQKDLGRYYDAIDSFKQGLVIQQSLIPNTTIPDSCHTAIADSYLEVGNTQLQIKAFDSAFRSFQNALRIRTDLLAKQQSAIDNCSNDQQVEESLLQDYKSALQLYKRALTVIWKYSSTLGSHDHLLRGNMNELKGRLDEKANTYHNLGIKELLRIDRRRQLTAALLLHQRALEIRRVLFGENHPQTADSYYNLGGTQWSINDFPSALQSNQRALDITLKVFSETHPKTADNYHLMGVIQRSMKDFTSALQSHQRALDIRLKLFGKNHPKTADSYYSLGITQDNMGDFTFALQAHQRALDIRLKLFGENHSDTADSYENLGFTQYRLHLNGSFSVHKRPLAILLVREEYLQTEDRYSSLGATQSSLNDFNSALQSFQRALDIRLKLFGEEHSKTAESYHSLGVTQSSMNDLNSALQSFQRTLDIRRKLFGKEHAKTAESYHDLGTIQCGTNNFSSALQSHQRALDIRLKLFGEDHPKTADSYKDLGNTYKIMNDFTSALQSHQRELDIRLKLLGEKHPTTADSYSSLGDTQRSMNDFPSALQSFQRALNIRLKLFGEQHPTTADSYHDLGVTLWSMDYFSVALQSHQRALDIRLKLFGEEHSKTADSYHEIGVTKCSMNKTTSALQSHQRALDIRLKLFGNEHSDTADSYHALGVSQRQKKDNTSALQSLQRAWNIKLRLFGENHPKTKESFCELLLLTESFCLNSDK